MMKSVNSLSVVPHVPVVRWRALPALQPPGAKRVSHRRPPRAPADSQGLCPSAGKLKNSLKWCEELEVCSPFFTSEYEGLAAFASSPLLMPLARFEQKAAAVAMARGATSAPCKRTMPSMMMPPPPPLEPNIGAPPAPPNSPTTMSASRMLQQYISRYSAQCGRSRFLKAAVVTPSTETSSDDLSDCAEEALARSRLSLQNEKDEVAQWECWRARTLASRPPAPPVVFSLRTRRLPPRGDRRHKTVPNNSLPWPVPAKQPRRRLTAAAPADGSSLKQTSPTLDRITKPSTADGDGRRGKARDIKLRPVKSQPTVSEVEGKVGQTVILSNVSSKMAPSEGSKDDDAKTPNTRKRTTEEYVREQLARLHPSDELFGYHSKTSMYEHSRRHYCRQKKKFQRRSRTRCSSHVKKKNETSGKRKKVPITNNDSSQQCKDIDGSSSKQAELTKDEQLQSPLQSNPTGDKTPEEKGKVVKKKAKKVISKLSTDAIKCDNELNKVNVDQTRCGENSIKTKANCKKRSIPFEKKSITLKRQPPKKKTQLRVCKTEPSSPLSAKDSKSVLNMDSQFLVTTISCGVLAYKPVFVNADGNTIPIQKDENINMNFQLFEENGSKSFEEKQKDDPMNFQPKDGILKHTILVEDLNVQTHQCSLSQLIAKSPTQGEDYVSQPSLNCPFLITPILPTDKPRTVRFDLTEQDTSSKVASCFFSAPEPNVRIEEVNEIEDTNILNSMKESIISFSSADSKNSLSGKQRNIQETSKKTRKQATSKTREKRNDGTTSKPVDKSQRKGVKASNLVTPLKKYAKLDPNSGAPKSEAHAVGPKYTPEPPRMIDYTVKRPSRNMACSGKRNIYVSPPQSTKCTKSSKTRQTRSSTNFLPIKWAENQNSLSPISTQFFTSDSDENCPPIGPCMGTTYIGDEFGGYVRKLPEEKRHGRESTSSPISRYSSDLTTTSSESIRSDAQVLYNLDLNTGTSLNELEVNSAPFPTRPNYAVLKPPWPDSDGKDILLRPPPKKCSKGKSRLARRSARICACEISFRLPCIDRTQQCNWKSSVAKTSTLQYLQKRLSQEKTALRSLRQRGCFSSAGSTSSQARYPGCACWLLPASPTPQKRSPHCTLSGW